MLRYLRQLTAESFVYGLSSVISRFIGILLLPIYTRVLTPEDYGVVSLMTSTMYLVITFAGLALDTASMRWYWDTEETPDRKRTMASWAWCQLAVSSLLGFMIYASADTLSVVLIGRADAGELFRINAFVLPLGTLGWVATNWLRLQRRPWQTMGFNLLTSLIHIFVTILLVAVLRTGIAGIFLSQAIAGLISSAIAIGLMKDWLHPRYFLPQRLREMLKYALPLIPAALAFWVVNSSSRYFIQSFSTTSEVGLFQVGSSFAIVVAVVSSAFQQAWNAFALSIHKRDEARQVFAVVFLAYCWISCFLSTAVALFAPEALRLLATEVYVGASEVVSFLAFSYAMVGLAQIAAIGPTVAKTTQPTGIGVTLAAGANILTNLLLVPPFGKVGAAAAALASQSVIPAYVFYRGQRIYPIPYRFGVAFALFVLSWVLIGIGSRLPSNEFWLSVAIKLILLSLFIPATFALRIVSVAQVVELYHRARLGLPARLSARRPTND